MSTKKKNTITKSKKRHTTANAGEPKMRVSQGHAAKLAIQSIDRLYKEIGLTAKPSKRTKASLLGNAQVPTQLVEEVAAAADQHGTLLGMKFDSDAARQSLAYAAAFEPVATKAEAFAARVRDAILVAKSETGSAALAAYAAMKGIVRLPEGAPLRDSFDKMTQIMKQRRKKKGAATATTPATPTPPAKAASAEAPATETTPAEDTTTTTTVVVSSPKRVA